MPTPDGSRTPISIDRLIKLLAEVRKIDGEMQAQTLMTLLMIARAPGISQVEIADKLDISKSTVSRNVTALSDYKNQRSSKGGYGFVTQRVDPNNRRYRQLFLTPEGQAAVQNLVAAPN
jgi:DNA-binding MarR family transcriptional regulator